MHLDAENYSTPRALSRHRNDLVVGRFTVARMARESCLARLDESRERDVNGNGDARLIMCYISCKARTPLKFTR